MSDAFHLDPRQVRRAFDRASITYDSAAGVQSEIRGRLLERLDVVRLEPARILDLGAGTGHASRALERRYRSAQVIAADSSCGMLVRSARQQGWLRRFDRLGAEAGRLPLKDGSIDLVFSSLMLEWCNEPDAVFSEVARVLRPRGLFMFATLGPDTLKQLRAAWSAVDPHTHVHRFIDMHDLGDALMRAGLAEPVMDTEQLTVTYPGVPELRRELKASGAGNLAAGRPRGLIGRARGERFMERAAASASEGRIEVSVEVVYGQAWAGTAAARRPSAEVKVPVRSIGRRGIIQ